MVDVAVSCPSSTRPNCNMFDHVAAMVCVLSCVHLFICFHSYLLNWVTFDLHFLRIRGYSSHGIEIQGQVKVCLWCQYWLIAVEQRVHTPETACNDCIGSGRGRSPARMGVLTWSVGYNTAVGSACFNSLLGTDLSVLKLIIVCKWQVVGFYSVIK